ncbi:MAG TPA: multicopper oxidase domain-containing protein [Burkholderiales bacterium]|nr:multicopper oxidase domain-containing protein [Burkholderiales bacterium]
MNRRRFLAAGLAALGAGCAPAAVRRPAVPGHVALADVRRLIVERADPIAGRCRYVADLGAEQVAQPILAARRGALFDAVIENRLPQPTTVHFHGLTLSEAQDGAGFAPIPPGEAKRVRFELLNRSGLYWFHPHPHGFTAEQVHAGLVGLLVVTDEEDEALDAALALAPGNRLALAIADVRVAADSIRAYAPDADDCLHGWLGNRALANGRLDAHWHVAPGWVRLQILNACNARGLLLAFRDGAAVVPFHLLGTDGGLLAAPQPLERVFLYTGERVDIAIDPRGRPALSAVSLEFDPRHHALGAAPRHVHPARERYAPLAGESVCAGAGGAAADRLPDGAELPLFALRVRGKPARGVPPLPARLSALAEPVAAADATTRRMRLDFDERSGFLIDATPYRLEETGFELQRGAREVWEIKNSPISMPHAMHLHGFRFRVLRRQGTYGAARALATAPGGRLATDLGLKDTVVLWPNETLWLGVDFTLPAQAAFSGPQRYMFHCHNLEHEDGMMMRNVRVL